MAGKWFAILRSGILDHLLAGKLGYGELGIYAAVHLQADFRTGIWVGSAPRILATAPRGTSLREVQRRLQTLTEIGFLRPFHTHGARGNFPWLIDKYEVKLGALKGKRLNALQSDSWRSPFYESCAEDDADCAADGRAEGVAEAAPYHESGGSRKDREKERTRTQTPRAIPSPVEHKRRIENRNQRLAKELNVAKEIACGGPIDAPRSFRGLHPDLFEQIVDLAKRRSM
jgi:hypothetical protein